MTSSSEYSLSTVLYLCLKPLRIFQASMYANSLLDLPTSCFMRSSFTFCSRVRADGLPGPESSMCIADTASCIKGSSDFIASLILSASICSYVLQSLFCSGLLFSSSLMCSSIAFNVSLMSSSLIIIIFHYEKSYIILHER